MLKLKGFLLLPNTFKPGSTLLARDKGDWLKDLFIISILLISGWKYTISLNSLLDIGLNDESTYLRRGVNFLTWSPIEPGDVLAETAPVYAAWYYLLSVWQPDPIQLYYFNYRTLTLIFPIVIYLILRRCNVSYLSSFIISFFLLISHANIIVWPKVNHFALYLILASFIVATYATFPNAYAILCFGALLGAYARPEIFVSFILLFLLYINTLVRKVRILQKFSKTAFVSLIATSGCVIVLLGSPYGGQASQERAWGAFAQHFSLNWVEWNNNNDLSPWTNSSEIINQSFGQVDSILEALRSNPVLFSKHIISNLIHIPQQLRITFLNYANLIFPSSFRQIESNLLVAVGGLYIFIKRHHWTSHLRDNIRLNKEILLAFCCYLIPAFISVFLIYPRHHYLLLPGVLIIIVMAIFLSNGRNVEQRSFNYIETFSLALIFIVLTPHITYYFGSEMKRPNVETIQFIRNLQLDRGHQINMLEADGGYCIYLEQPCHRTAEYEKQENCVDFLKNKQINMIVISERLQNYNRFKNDYDCMNFLNDYAKFGFTQLDISNTDRKLIISNEILR